MAYLIFKTNVRAGQEHKLLSCFTKVSLISEWTIDTKDVDCVLRVRVSEPVEEDRIVELVNACGFQCEELPD